MLTFSDTTELAAEISAIDGLDLTEARAVAAEHLRRLPHGAGAGPVCTNCGAYGHTAIDCPEPPLPRPPARLVSCDPPTEPAPEPTPFPRQVNWSDRERCSFCCGNHPTDACPLRSRWHAITLLVQPTRCSNCHGAHHIQQCPELWQAVREHQPDMFNVLREVRTTIAELRAAGLHSSAESLRENALCKVEAWLDPEAAAVRQEQLAAGRELVRATLAERVEIDGVAVPF